MLKTTDGSLEIFCEIEIFCVYPSGFLTTNQNLIKILEPNTNQSQLTVTFLKKIPPGGRLKFFMWKIWLVSRARDVLF